MIRKLTAPLFALFLMFASLANLIHAAESESSPAAKVIQVQKIWSHGKHNAFTDLIRYQDEWFCVFREGEKHVSSDGALRVLASRDGRQWESAALISAPGLDLRDAKICITPENELMLSGAGVTQPPLEKSHQSYYWISRDGRTWSEPHPFGEKNYWIWRTTWHDGSAYAVGYRTGLLNKRNEDGHIRLYKSDDGHSFETLVPDLGVRGAPNESSLLFLENGAALCVARRDGSPDASAMLGQSNPPYQDWTWRSLGVRIGGPQVIQLPSGEIVIAGRKYSDGAKTALWKLDRETATLQELAILPSGGDTSYPGLVYHNDTLWVSYYSSHEGKTSIYLSQVKFPQQ